MILGVDIGNYATKTSSGIIFPSRCSKVGNILSNKPFQFENEKYYIGEGNHDTEYRKVKKAYTRALFAYAIAKTTTDTSNRVVVGLPLSQYKNDKEEMEDLLNIKGVSDIVVYPEGVGAIAGTDFEGIVIDIGGRTTDTCQVIDNSGIKKVTNPFSLPMGTLNLYSDFIKIVNARYGLDLMPEEGERILKKGLFIDGERADLSMATDVFKQYVDELISIIRLEYSVKTNSVLLVGGGAALLHKPILNRIPAARLAENSVFANANGFRRVGEQLWR